MFIGLFETLKRAGVPVSLRELLDLHAVVERGVVFADMEAFYQVARTVMVKDERHFDRFDRAFAAWFKGLEDMDAAIEALIPDEWLRREFEKQLTDEEKAKIESLGGLEELIETFKKRLEEQKERHAGGNKWIGTGGTSPFGAYGYNPEGIRIGQDGSRHRRATKVWDERRFRDYDDSQELGTRNIKMALRRLRKFARQALGTSSMWTVPFAKPPAMPGCSISRCARSATMRSRCCCFWTWAARWMTTFASVKSYSRRPALSLSTWSTSTFITACMKACGEIISAVATNAFPPWMCCTPTARIIRW